MSCCSNVLRIDINGKWKSFMNSFNDHKSERIAEVRLLEGSQHQIYDIFTLKNDILNTETA